MCVIKKIFAMAVFGILLLLPAHAETAQSAALVDITLLQFFGGAAVLFGLSILTVRKEKAPSVEA